MQTCLRNGMKQTTSFPERVHPRLGILRLQFDFLLIPAQSVMPAPLDFIIGRRNPRRPKNVSPVQFFDFCLLPLIERFLILIGFLRRGLTAADAEGAVFCGSGFVQLAAGRTVE